jgi:hypothetical protein
MLIWGLYFMAKKIRRVRTFARTAAKSMERKLVDNAKELQNDPYLILPEYSDNYSTKIFNKIKKNLDKIIRFKDDIDKLEKLSNKRDLGGALAGTLTIAHSEKAPYLGVAKYPTGDVFYAQRGRADKEKLIAFQHFDNPVLRLLGIKDIALKKRLHVYSWDDGFISTGVEANPPKEFINFLMKKTNLTLKNSIASCGDIKPDVVKNKEIHNKNYLRIHWKSADVIIAICEDCAKSTKNTIFHISKYIIEPNISDDFLIEVIGQVIKQKDTSSEQLQKLDEYLSGKITDLQLIEENMKYREETLKESGEKIFILDGNSFGTNIDGFIKALKPNKFEKEGLELILEKVDEPVIFDDTTSNKVLEKYWKDHGLDTINSILGNDDMSEKFFSLDDSPSDILELVFNFKQRQKILSQLPKYKQLPKLAKFIDDVVRTYKTFGEREALAEIKKRPDDPKAKSISYAFLLAFGKGKDKKWQYSQVEIEYGEFLKDFTKKLLDSDSKNYHKALKDLLTSSGSSENIDDYIKK